MGKQILTFGNTEIEKKNKNKIKQNKKTKMFLKRYRYWENISI